jgi:hypothetical protein
MESETEEVMVRDVRVAVIADPFPGTPKAPALEMLARD